MFVVICSICRRKEEVIEKTKGFEEENMCDKVKDATVIEA